MVWISRSTDSRSSTVAAALREQRHCAVGSALLLQVSIGKGEPLRHIQLFWPMEEPYSAQHERNRYDPSLRATSTDNGMVLTVPIGDVVLPAATVSASELPGHSF
jgi:hypothetical protein